MAELRTFSSMRATMPVLFGLVIYACSDNVRQRTAIETGGTLVISTPQDPGTLFPPFVELSGAKQITEQIYDYLADVGPGFDTRSERDYRPELADGWRWSRDSLSLAFHINPRARWHDGRSVGAGDVRFTFDLNKNPSLGGRYVSSLANIDSVTASDSLTAVFWFHRRSPTQFLDAAAQLLILPAHLLDKISLQRLREIDAPIVGSGRFRMGRREQGANVEIVADIANYRGRARLDRVIWNVTPDPTAAVTSLKRGDLDLFENLGPDHLKELANQPTVRVVTIPTMDYIFLRFNLRDPAHRAKPHPLFGNRDLRRAITMSIDRKALLRNVLDTFAVVPSGPTVRAYATTDSTLAQIPFDSAKSGALLDSLGWIRGENGMRSRDGRHLAFNILVRSSSPNRMRMAVLLQEKFRQMGIRATVESMEFQAQLAREEKGDFDTSLDNLTMPSSPDATRDAWTSSGIGKNGVNYGSYSNPRFDVLLDSALMSDPGHARARFSAAYSVINDDAPAVWLYEPRKILGVGRRFKMAQIRPDSWWFSLADWYVDPADRVLRDRIPVQR